MNPAERERLYTGQFWLLWGAHFVCGTAIMSMPVLALYFDRELGADPGAVGVLFATASASSILCRPAIGRILDRSGRRLAFLLAGSLAAIPFFLYPALPFRSLAWPLYLLRGFHGIGMGGLFGTYFTYAADLAPPTRRAEGIAVFGASGLASLGAGPVLGDFLRANWSFDAYFLVMGALAAASVVATLGLAETRTASPRLSSSGFRATLVERPVAYLWPTAFLLGAVLAAMSVFTGLVAEDRGIGSLGAFFVPYAVAAFLVRVGGSRALDRVGLERVVAIGFLPLAASALLVAGASHQWQLWAAGVLAGTGHGILFPALSALAILRSASERRGMVVSIFTGILELGALVANPVCGEVAGVAGSGAMFAGLAGLAAAGLLWFLAAEILAREPGEERRAEVEPESTRASDP